MFERFTERARQVVVLAQQNARDTHADRIQTSDLLVGCLREEEGLAARVLDSLDITLERLVEWSSQTQAETELLEPGVAERVAEGQIPFTALAKTGLELALREALSLGHNYIGTEHILLGLVRGSNVTRARSFLANCEVREDQIRNEVIRMLSGPGGRQAPSEHPVDEAEDENAAEMLARMGTSGEAWADEFLTINPQVVAVLSADGGREDALDTLRGWFANAIEAGITEGQSRPAEEIVYNERHEGARMLLEGLEKLGMVERREPGPKGQHVFDILMTRRRATRLVKDVLREAGVHKLPLDEERLIKRVLDGNPDVEKS